MFKLIALLTLVSFAVGAPAEGGVRQGQNDDRYLKSLCATNDHHCVYIQQGQAWIYQSDSVGCDSKGTTCVFPAEAQTKVSCTRGGQVNVSFGDRWSSFTTHGSVSAYWSSHNGDTDDTTSQEAGDDIHVSCSENSNDDGYDGEHHDDDNGGDNYESRNNGGGWSGKRM